MVQDGIESGKFEVVTGGAMEIPLTMVDGRFEFCQWCGRPLDEPRLWMHGNCRKEFDVAVDEFKVNKGFVLFDNHTVAVNIQKVKAISAERTVGNMTARA